MSDKPTKEARFEQERSLDKSLEDTFPASDPVSIQQLLIVGRAPRSAVAGVPRPKGEKQP
jgi:hypothetical protein